MDSDMVKPEKVSHLHLVYHFTISLSQMVLSFICLMLSFNFLCGVHNVIAYWINNPNSIHDCEFDLY